MNRLISAAWGPINISTGANAVYTYTATKDASLRIQVYLDAVAGGATDYIAWAQVQRLGAGSSYPVLPRTTGTGIAGWTALAFSTITLDVYNTDVVTVWVDGQAADMAVSGYIRIVEDDYLRPAVAGQYTTAIDANGRTDLGAWLGAAPAALTANGYLQAALLRWLTDNAAGTPNALVANRVDAYVGAMGLNTLTANALADDACAEIAGCVLSGLLAQVTPIQRVLRTDPLELYRGDTWIQYFTKLGNIAARTNMWLAVKRDKDDADTAAQIFIDENTGLLYIAGGAATVPLNGTITVTDAASGDGFIRLEAVEAAKLTAVGNWWYDIQWTDGTDVITPQAGRFLVTRDVARVV